MFGMVQKEKTFVFCLFLVFVLVATIPTFILQGDKNIVEALNELQPCFHQSKVQKFSFSFISLPHYLVKI
jgi:hypothetical protein